MIEKGFDHIRERAEKEGLDWKSAKIGYDAYRISLVHDMTMADIKLYMSDKKSNYKFSIDNCVKIKRGWILTSGRMNLNKR